MRMTDDQIAALNTRLRQLSFATMGDYARALTEQELNPPVAFHGGVC